MSYFVQDFKNLSQGLIKSCEGAFVEQLKDLHDKGLIEIKLTGDGIYQSFDKTLHFGSRCEIVLKSQEYIEKLEKENKELKTVIARLKEVL